MTPNDILAWHDFFGIVAQVGATLAGLLFVGLTISLDHVLKAQGYLSRAFTALYLQFEILVIGIFGLLPGQSVFALGVELICTGVIFLVGVSAFARSFPEDENSTVLSSKGAHAVRTVLVGLATLGPVVSGTLLIAHWPRALYWLIPGILAAIYLSIGYSWIFAIEIPRRQRQGEKT